MVPETPFSDEQLERALAALSEPGRLRDAERLVASAAPSLQRVLATALSEGGWFDGAQAQAVSDAASREELGERVRALQTLLAEETRLGMLVGVAVGYELAHELRDGAPDQESHPDPQEDP